MITFIIILIVVIIFLYFTFIKPISKKSDTDAEVDEPIISKSNIKKKSLNIFK